MSVSVITVGGNSINLVSIAQTLYTDLVIGSIDTQITSAAQPFGSAAVGSTIVITAGTGFTPGGYSILSVVGAVAQLDRAVGTAGSTGGSGSIGAGPGLRQVQFEMEDAVATVTSTFTGQMQAQQWPGADMWRGTMTLPPIAQADADNWLAFLMELRGMANAFQLGDPMKRMPRGTGAGTMTANGAQGAGSQTLAISGASGTAALLPGDYVQIGYRLYRVLEQQDSDTASVGIWPSLREALDGGESIAVFNTLGLWRLATNKRTWSADYTKLSRISFQIQEYR